MDGTPHSDLVADAAATPPKRKRAPRQPKPATDESSVRGNGTGSTTEPERTPPMNSAPKPDPASNGAAPFNPWLLTVPASGTGEYYVCSPGSHPGTIIGMIHIGHQVNKFSSKEDANEKVDQGVVVFELVERRPDGKPFIMAKSYSLSLHEKANLYKLVCGLSGRTFGHNEDVNVLNILGLPVLVLVGNSQSGEKSYHKVETVAPYPKGMAAPRPINPLYAYSVTQTDAFNPPFEVPFIFGVPIETLMAESDEYRSRIAAKVNQTTDKVPF
jgi:hypothetical protein